MLKKHGMLGNHEIIYFENEKDGEYSYINGEWIFIEKTLSF
jgi:hypothetical protein